MHTRQALCLVAAAFRTVRKNTVQIAEDVPEDKYDFKPSPESRSIRQTLAHIAVATTFPTMLHGERIPIEKIDFMEYMKRVNDEEGKPRNKAEMVALLKDSGEKFAAMLEKLEDPFIGEVITFGPDAEPPSRTRFDMLLAIRGSMHGDDDIGGTEQCELRRVLGVTAGVVSRMLKALEKLGLVQRARGDDRRYKGVWLSANRALPIGGSEALQDGVREAWCELAIRDRGDADRHRPRPAQPSPRRLVARRR